MSERGLANMLVMLVLLLATPVVAMPTGGHGAQERELEDLLGENNGKIGQYTNPVRQSKHPFCRMR